MVAGKLGKLFKMFARLLPEDLLGWWRFERVLFLATIFYAMITVMWCVISFAIGGFHFAYNTPFLVILAGEQSDIIYFRTYYNSYLRENKGKETEKRRTEKN